MKLTKKLISLVVACIMVFSLIGVLPASANDTTPNFIVYDWKDELSGYDNTSAKVSSTDSGVTFETGVFTESSHEAAFIKDGENDVLSIGPDATGWTTKWTFTSNVKDTFKFAFKIKIPEFTWDKAYAEDTMWWIRLWNYGQNNTNKYGNGGNGIQNIYLRALKNDDGSFKCYNIGVQNIETDERAETYDIPADKLVSESTATKDWILIEAEVNKNTKDIKLYVDGVLGVTQSLCDTTADLDLNTIDLAKRNGASVVATTAYFDDFTFYDATYGETVALSKIDVAKGDSCTLPATVTENSTATPVKWETNNVSTAYYGMNKYMGKTADKAYSVDVAVGKAANVKGYDDMSTVEKINYGEAKEEEYGPSTDLGTGMSVSFKKPHASNVYKDSASFVSDGSNKVMSIGPGRTYEDHVKYTLDTTVSGDFKITFRTKLTNTDKTTAHWGYMFELLNSNGVKIGGTGTYIQTDGKYKIRPFTNTSYSSDNTMSEITLSGTSPALYSAEWANIEIFGDVSEKTLTYTFNGSTVAVESYIKSSATEPFNLAGIGIFKNNTSTSTSYIDDIKVIDPSVQLATFTGYEGSVNDLTIGMNEAAPAMDIKALFNDDTSEDIKLSVPGGIATDKLGTKTYTAYPEGSNIGYDFDVTVCNYEVKNPVFKDGSNADAEEPVVGGKLASVYLKHWSNEYADASALFAYYEDGSLVNVKVVPITDIVKGNEAKLDVNLELGDTVTDKGALRVFIFSSTSGLKPVDLSRVYTNNGFFN